MKKETTSKQYGYYSSAVRYIKKYEIKHGKQLFVINRLDEGCYEVINYLHLHSHLKQIDMYSPFYTAEQKRLYPHRKRANNHIDVFNHMTELIANGTETLEHLENTRLGVLQHNYFLNASINDILEAFKIFEKNLELQK